MATWSNDAVPSGRDNDDDGIRLTKYDAKRQRFVHTHVWSKEKRRTVMDEGAITKVVLT